MTAKDKAKELTQKMYDASNPLYTGTKYAKQCAIIAVDEILKLEVLYQQIIHAKWNLVQPESSVEFWENVKKEIEKL